ncbi:spore coat associated protein CotJA [Clostridium algidicarnis]|uniref:spore coat associated protein CotJA n=1 Tax=Clostridium algidicarnis TaxID=37659 RepID=UPI001A9B66B7|nr:spore coat associated protein CotJA [Clostridium algidicarnis]
MFYMEDPEDSRLSSDCITQKKCIPQETVITNVRLAAAYVPYQKLCTLFSPIESLKRGTVFPELYSPFEGENKKGVKLSKSEKGGCYER